MCWLAGLPSVIISNISFILPLIVVVVKVVLIVEVALVVAVALVVEVSIGCVCELTCGVIYPL